MGDEFLGIGLNTIGNMMQMGQNAQNATDQFHHQQALNQQMQQIQQQNWNYTNFENQRKHMENAGLNVGLMYGMGGAGGSTMGGASGGSAAMAQSTDNIGSNIMAQMLQQKAIESQVELNKASANKEQALADETNKWKKGNIEADTAGKTLENRYKAGNLENQLEQTALENKKLVNENKISQIEADYKLQEKKLELAGLSLNNILTKSKTNLTNEQIEQTKQDVINSIKNTLANQRNSYSNERNSQTNEWISNVEKELKLKGLDLQETQQVLDVLKTIIGASIIRK